MRSLNFSLRSPRKSGRTKSSCWRWRILSFELASRRHFGLRHFGTSIHATAPRAESTACSVSELEFGYSGTETAWSSGVWKVCDQGYRSFPILTDFSHREYKLAMD